MSNSPLGVRRVSRMRFGISAILLILLFPAFAYATLSPSLLPISAGTYNEWVPKSGTTHYTQVDESVCNGTTDYVATSTTGKRDSFGVSLASIPNSAIVTGILVTPCAGRATTGGGSSVLNVFYRWNGTNSTDKGAYAPSGTTPTALATSTWNAILLPKTSTSTLEVGMIYTSGTKGARLSRIATQLVYGLLPSATTSPASLITPFSALLHGTANPNGSSTTAWFRIATTSPGSCNDTFGIRVPVSGGVSIGGGVFLNGNSIYDNSSYGVWDDTFLGINSQYNYWGSSDGPSGDGPGSGDAVHDADFANWLTQPHYLWHDNNGFNSAVDAGKRISYSVGTSVYASAWYRAVDTWNAYGNTVDGVIIATSTATSSPVLQLEDLAYDSSSIIAGQYFPLEQKIKFQPYYMGSSTDVTKWNDQINVTTHELGHALGLWHSFAGQMMNSYMTGTTTLQFQDKSDYDYCWAGNNNVCR